MAFIRICLSSMWWSAFKWRYCLKITLELWQPIDEGDFFSDWGNYRLTSDGSCGL